jgi:hypothetical protein
MVGVAAVPEGEGPLVGIIPGKQRQGKGVNRSHRCSIPQAAPSVRMAGKSKAIKDISRKFYVFPSIFEHFVEYLRLHHFSRQFTLSFRLLKTR